MLVKTLVSARKETGRRYENVWNGRNQADSSMPSDVYIANLSVDGKSRGRMINLVE